MWYSSPRCFWINQQIWLQLGQLGITLNMWLYGSKTKVCTNQSELDSATDMMKEDCFLSWYFVRRTIDGLKMTILAVVRAEIGLWLDISLNVRIGATRNSCQHIYGRLKWCSQLSDPLDNKILIGNLKPEIFSPLVKDMQHRDCADLIYRVFLVSSATTIRLSVVSNDSVSHGWMELNTKVVVWNSPSCWNGKERFYYYGTILP